MAKKTKTASSYTSEFTESVASERDYADPYDIALVYNTASHMNETISKTKDMLTKAGYTVRSSMDHEMNAGELKAARFGEEVLPAKYRIIFINKAYKKHDLPFHAPMLYNREVMTREDTMVVIRKKHDKILPVQLKDLHKHVLEEVTAEEAAKAVTKFAMQQVMYYCTSCAQRSCVLSQPVKDGQFQMAGYSKQAYSV